MAKQEGAGLPWIIPAGIAVLITSAVFAGEIVVRWMSTRLPIVPPGTPLAIPDQPYRDEVTAQEWSAFAGMASVGVNSVTLLSSILTLVVLVLTFCATRRMLKIADNTLKETREIGRAQTRSYVHLEVLSWTFDWGNSTPYLTYTYGNSGNSPALFPELIIRARRSIHYLDHRPSAETHFVECVTLQDIPAGTKIDESTLTLSSYILEPDELPGNEVRSVSFHVEVTIICRDVFKELQFAFSSYLQIYQFELGIIRPIQGIRTTFLSNRPNPEQLLREHLVFSRRHNMG